MQRLIVAVVATLITIGSAQATTTPKPPSFIPNNSNTETRWVQNNKHIPIWKKLNPIWWFLNDDQQTVDQAPWYEPTWPEPLRIFVWNCCRNPLQNFRSYVLGVQDKSFYVTAKKPWGTIQRNDLCTTTKGQMVCQQGYQWHWLWGGDLLFPLPFLSYSGNKVVWYFGWQPGGFAGAKFNLHNCSVGYSQSC